MNLYLIRHGEDEDNAKGLLNDRRDTPLTQKGRDQAYLVADRISELHLQFDAVYTSPLKRCTQTADIISLSANAPKPLVMENLIEREFGMMTGKKVEEILSLCSPDVIRTEKIIYFLHSDGAETFTSLFKRAQGIMADLEGKDSKNILLVTHGDIGKMIYAAFHNLDWKEALTHFHFDNGELILLSGH